MKINCIITTLTILLFTTNANAARIISSDAYYEDDRFFVSITALVDATPKEIYRTLTDYENITKISPKIIESTLIRKSKNINIVRTVVKGCVLFFCREVTNTQVVTSKNKKDIISQTVPKYSNLKFGKMEWHIAEDDYGTKIEYSAEIEPDFFVPPIIGTYFIKNALLTEAETFVNGVEKLANHQPINHDD